MPSARSAKRAAAPALPAAAPAEKRAKQDPLMRGVTDAIGQAEGLPETCREMLVAVAPGCLGTPLDQRHEQQSVMVSWIGEVVDGVKAKLQEGVEEADAIEAKAAEVKEGLDGKVEAAKASSQQKDEALDAASATLKATTEAAAGAKVALEEAQEAQRTGDARLVEAGEEKKGLDEALERHVKSLKEEESFQADRAEAHLAVLVPIAKRLSLDDSLLAALPAVSARAPGARGAFDHMVVEQLEASLQGQVAALAGELDTGAPAAAERAAAVAAAREAWEAAEAAKAAADAALTAAHGAQAEAVAALKEAEAAVAAFVSGRSAEVRAREKRVFALQNFSGYNEECFKTLRDRTASAGA